MKAPVALIGAIVVALFAVNLVTLQSMKSNRLSLRSLVNPYMVIDKPGLYFKMPDPIQKTTRFERWL